MGGFVVGICAGPTPTQGFALESINICPIFATPSPTGFPSPTPTSKHVKPTPTATATACSPPSAVSTVSVNGFIQFAAQGVLTKGGKTEYEDITNSPNTYWGSYPPMIVVNPGPTTGGIYQGEVQGCTCFGASAGTLSSLQYAIQVGTPLPACGPCATPTATPTATSTPKVRGSYSMDFLMPPAGTTMSSATAQWTIESNSPVAGAIIPGRGGRAYFITRDALLHAIDSRGHQVFDRPAGGTAVAVAPDGTIIVQGTTDWLYGLTPSGVPRWKVQVGTGGNPIAADDGAAYVSVSGNLVSVSSRGQINWSIPADSAAAGAIIPGGVVIAAAGGAVSAYSTTGSQLWSRTPAGGFAGNLVVFGTTVYCGSRSGTMVAIDSDTGAQDFSVAGAGAPIAGPVVDSTGQVYFGAGALYAVDSSGATRWVAKSDAPAAGDLAVDAAGDVYIASPGGTITKFGGDGTPGWSSRSAGKVLGLATSPSGEVYVASSDGRVSALK